MTISSMHDRQSGRSSGIAYTVVCKSGQRGTEYSDPDQAARPSFVRRSRIGHSCYVIEAMRPW